MIKRTHILIPLIAILLTACKPEAPKTYPQDRLTVEYTVDKESIRVGDPVELIVTTLFPTNGMLVLPEIGREKDVVLLSRDWTDIEREDALTQSESRYSITSFRLGEHLVSTGMISCALGEQLFSTNFPAVTLQVGTSLNSESSTAIADIKDIHKLPGRIPEWIWIALGSAIAAFLIGLITSKLWKNRKTLIPSAPPIPPHVIAFHALETLKNRGLLEKDECNPFYTELSLILRTYLEGRFCLNAPDETTEEIVKEMSKSPELDLAQKGILQEFMHQADMVKFAKGHPDRSTMETAFDTTKEFVEETKGIPTVAEVTTTEVTPEELHYAGFWIRILAYLLDVIPIAAVMAAFYYFILGFDLSLSEQLQQSSSEEGLDILLTRFLMRNSGFIIWILYGYAMELSPLQGTLGKRIVGIKVVNENGMPLSGSQASTRMFMKLVSYIVLGLGFIWAAFTKKKQGWHDKIAKSYVVYRKNKRMK